MKQGVYKKKGCLYTYKKALRRIHLVDRCLLIFMGVLLLQTAYSLFFSGGGEELEHIDVVLRTSTAGIFGYLLSANFIRHGAAERQPPRGTPPHLEVAGETITGAPVGQIGFAVEQTTGETAAVLPAPPAQTVAETVVAGRLQILVAAGIGLFALLLMILVRNVGQWQTAAVSSNSAVATMTQLRDLVSGCVGFLIGSPTEGGRSD